MNLSETADDRRLYRKIGWRIMPLLLAAYVVEDRERNEWLLSLLYHLILGDRTASELVRTELGKRLQAGWSEPSPSPSLRALIKQASSVSPAQYETYFRKGLAGIDQPTAPFRLPGTRQDTSGPPHGAGGRRPAGQRRRGVVGPAGSGSQRAGRRATGDLPQPYRRHDPA